MRCALVGTWRSEDNPVGVHPLSIPWVPGSNHGLSDLAASAFSFEANSLALHAYFLKNLHKVLLEGLQHQHGTTFSTSLPAFGGVTNFNYSHSHRWILISHWDLIFISSITWHIPPYRAKEALWGWSSVPRGGESPVVVSNQEEFLRMKQTSHRRDEAGAGVMDSADEGKVCSSGRHDAAQTARKQMTWDH